MSATLSVDVATQDNGWLVRVRIDSAGQSTEHLVTVRGDYFDKIAGSETTVEDLARASFEFLLEHEPPEAILRRFDLAVIGQYFPEYEAAMKKRFDQG